MKIPSWTTFVKIALAASLSTAAFAQATRTWISGVGDDVNPCSRTAPCKTFAGAISKTATNGEIDTLDPGGFGTVNITKSMTLYAAGGPGGITSPGTNAITINNATGSLMSVTLRGLNLDGTGAGINGIQVIGSSPIALHVENTQIYGITGNGINIATAAAVDVTVSGSRISECTGVASNGINADGAAGAVNVTLTDTEIHNCNTGLNVVNAARVDAHNSDFSHNVTGVMVTGTGSEALLDSAMITFCTTGISSTGSGTVRLSNTSITDNATGLSSATSGVVASFSNNRIKGNTVNGAPTTTIFMN
jgi:hypothetical protein